MEVIIEKIKKFRENIKENPNVEINEAEWKDFLELSNSSIQWIIEDLANIGKITMEPKYYSVMNFSSLSIKWKSKSQNYFLYGGFHINGIFEALSNPSTFWKIDFSLPSDAAVPDNLKHFEKLNWFEKQAWGDDWRYGCFVRGVNKFPPKIAFFDRNWYTLLNLSFEDYLEAMIVSCAVKGWQYFYIDWNQEILHKSIALEDMELAVKALPELFPKQDFTYHIDKLNEVKGLK
ncbi:hypothetical protein ATE84_1145 [Aquimarina sp. MAR_2010_214]|uniref:hypothetical protein n=1 Tax=Aquimarina sp. MAR_2010_214 TaxID=1250026 RepID=UPI000C7013C1|nr:hypothetical protein [Aquimarina sp. MAR_2010_214]PKV49128.1 hypothetical protein ATE84_1145 [Aquimarina sp. MAR_2010_214]